MLTPSQIELIKATVPVLQAHGVDLTKHFYSRMLKHNPELRNVFNHAHQAHGAQQQALAAAVLAYAQNIENLGVLAPAVEQIAQRHCSLGIRAEQYAIVGKHLLASIQEVLGEAATPELVDAWAAAYGQLADILIKAEQDIYNKQTTAEGGWSGWRPFECVNRVQESADAVSLYFRPTDGGAVPAWQPGQYATLRVYSQSLQLTQPRQYTLSHASGTGFFRITVKAIPSAEGDPEGVVSNQLHRTINIGDTVEFSAPTGRFCLDADDVKSEHPLVLIAAGIGITPIFAMLDALATENPMRKVHVLYSARDGKHFPLRNDLENVVKAMPNAALAVFFTRPTAEDHLGKDYQSAGRITPERIRSFCQDPDADFYVCGPMSFMRDISNGLRLVGVIAPRIHTEAFGTGSV
ncbi:NO-inducible flavohemoprotein [Sutterella sp.]|uniref:NO-inducible flavohemoprotein n=1 Tax=Sutterella sp. TaxID=1981025 RepID=UPI0026DF114F|nr:NO-inducible flavohemoprotein [Sutterella sp.]MDO5530960.1 NO-inducible flavohemoprotein [Sutterella sp.]